MQFIVQYRPTRSDILATMTPIEETAIGDHFDYLTSLLNQGVLVFAGRRDDAAFGIAVFHADSEQHAKSIVDRDPAVAAGVFTASVGAFEFALAAVPGLM